MYLLRYKLISVKIRKTLEKSSVPQLIEDVRQAIAQRIKPKTIRPGTAKRRTKKRMQNFIF
jgi:dihydroneopterin aldolase